MCVCVSASLSHLNHPPLSHSSQSLFYSPSWRGRLRALKLGHQGVDFKKEKGWTLAAEPHAGRGERDGAIDGSGAEESDEWKGQDRTTQPRCWGRYFWTARRGRSARLSASALSSGCGGPQPRRRPESPQGHAPHLFC